MGRKLDKWMTTGSAALVLAALLACKSDEDKAPEPVASASPEPAQEPEKKAEEAPAAAPSGELKADDKVKRYGDKEKEERGTVRVIVHNLRVYPEADESTEKLTTLNKGTLVNLKARYDEYFLIEYPSGPGELSLGWIRSKQTVSAIVAKPVASASAAPQPAASAAPAPAATGAPAAAPPRRRRRR